MLFDTYVGNNLCQEAYDIATKAALYELCDSDKKEDYQKILFKFPKGHGNNLYNWTNVLLI
jgi:hypothetical protein